MSDSNKKAQGMSFKVIIVAVIALVILIVLILIFTGKSRMFVNQTGTAETAYVNNCAMPGTAYTCRSSEDCRSMDGFVIAGKDCSGGEVCCSQ